MNKFSATPGICRIDQPHKYNHGFFVRLARRKKIHSAYFADKKYGGKEAAFAAAQDHYRKLRIELGEPEPRSRLFWEEVRRRKGRSGLHGVRRIIDRRVKPWRKYWKATWSPKPYVVARRQFSIRKHGEAEARRLAIQAWRDGLRSMTEAR